MIYACLDMALVLKHIRQQLASRHIDIPAGDAILLGIVESIQQANLAAHMEQSLKRATIQNINQVAYKYAVLDGKLVECCAICGRPANALIVRGERHICAQCYEPAWTKVPQEVSNGMATGPVR